MQLPKYVRIQGRETAWVTKKPVGFFALAWRKARDGVFNEEDKKVFLEAENWFKDHLPHPPFYGENNDDALANTDGAITYFKNNADTEVMFARLEPILALLDKYEVPYDVVYTNYVGTIVYEDAYQVGVVDETK